MAITFSSTSGTSGVTNIEITATERLDDTNYSKNYVISNDDMSLGMTVAQKAYAPVGKYITLSPSAISWTSSESTDSITVNSNDDWVVMSDGWIELSRMYSSRGNIEGVNVVSGNGNTIIGIRCSENTGSTRTGGITAYCQSDSSITATTTVSQAGGYVKPYIMLGTYSMSVGSSSATTAVSVTSNVSWSAITDSRWITINTLTGSGDGSVSFTVDANESDIERRGAITVYNGELSAVLVISQQASSFKPYIILTPDTFNVASTGSTNTITVSANCEYDIAADVPWITVNAVYGSGNGSVSFTTASNSGSTDVGNIEFSNTALSRTVSVERQGVEKYLSANTNSVSSTTSGDVFSVLVYSNVNWSVSVDEGEVEEITPWITVSPSSGSNNGSISISVASGSSEKSGSVTLSSSKFGLSYTISVSRTDPYRNTVFYKSTGGSVINPTVSSGWGATIVSNTYVDGQGMIMFDGPVSSVPQRAFSGKTALTEITIPSTVGDIGISSFYGCSSLKSISIPDSVTEIKQSAFNNCSVMTSVEIGRGVDTIGPYAFQSCNGLTTIEIPSNVKILGDYAFSSCQYLTAATVDAASIGAYSFDQCQMIFSLILGKNVSSIGNRAFRYGSRVQDIYSKASTQPTLGTEVFYHLNSSGTLHYPTGSDYSRMIAELPNNWTAVADL